jgi:hypothetical protein
MTRMAFTVVVEVTKQAYVGDQISTVHDSDIASMIEAAIWKTYANPGREDAGITSVISVEHVNVEYR